MKKLLFIIMICSSIIMYGQTTLDENANPSLFPIGISYQLGPGTNNTVNWTYKYGSKISLIGSGYRNFEIGTTSYPNGDLVFRQWDVTNQNWTTWRKIIIEDENGKLGIGKSNPTAKLHVNGNIIAEEIKVENVTGADFVFTPDYILMPLQEIEAFVKQNHHLPEVPSAAEMEANGVELGKMNMLLLQKIEELTLLMIQQQKQIEQQNIKTEKQDAIISEFIKNQEK